MERYIPDPDLVRAHEKLVAERAERCRKLEERWAKEKAEAAKDKEKTKTKKRK